MMQDILTVMWRERRGLLRVQGSRSRFFVILLSPVLMAVVAPWEEGKDWFSSPLPVILSAVIAFLLVGTLIPDAFAGERERNTLETLLATRLPDRAILLGKFLASVVFGLGVTAVFLALSLVVANISAWEGGLRFFVPTIGWGSLALSLVVATLVGGLGILISLRSSTVQEATQLLMAVLLAPIIALQAVGLLMADQLRDFLRQLDGQQVLLFTVGALATVDLAVFLLALARFHRARLIAG